VKHLEDLLGDHDLHVVPDEAMRHTVADRVDVDQGVERHATPEPLLAPRQGARRQRAQHRALVAVEADQRRFTRGPVPTLIGDRHPRRQVLLERSKGLERLVGQRVAFHILHAGFRLALRPGAIRRAGARLHVPITTEREVGGMEDHRAGRAVARPDQRPGIIPEQGARDATEMRERGGDPIAPVGAALIEKRFDEEAPGVAEDRDEEEDADAHAGDLQTLLAEIDLQLVAGRRLDPHRRQLRDSVLPPDVRHGALERAHADRESVLGQQPLHDDRIAGRRPGVQRPCFLSPFVRQTPRCGATLDARLDRPTQIPSDGIHRDADLAGNGLLPDTATRQRPDRGHHLAFDHRHLLRRRYQHVPLELHSTLLPRGSELVSRGGQYHCRSTASPHHRRPSSPRARPYAHRSARACTSESKHSSSA